MTRKRQPRWRDAVAHSPPRQPAAMNPQLATTILDIVDTQLLGGTPPETRQTFDRLITAGYTPEGARQLLAHVVVSEIYTVMERGERYDMARFVAALHQLPILPDGDESDG